MYSIASYGPIAVSTLLERGPFRKSTHGYGAGFLSVHVATFRFLCHPLSTFTEVHILAFGISTGTHRKAGEICAKTALKFSNMVF